MIAIYNEAFEHLKENLDKWLLVFLTGLFMFVVLYVYQGYNISNTISYSGHSLFIRALTHASATSLVFYVFELHIRSFFKIDDFKKMAIWIAIELFVGLTLNFLIFNYFWNWTELVWKSYFLFFYEYPLVVLLPIITVQTVVKKEWFPFINDIEYLKFSSLNGKKNFRIKQENLLYLQSSYNYVEIYYLADQTLNTCLLRTSLKEIDGKIGSSLYLIRCHRSYMVNPKNIDQMVWTNKDLKLILGSKSIPVSKKYFSYFK